jgi:hypothetical protein
MTAQPQFPPSDDPFKALEDALKVNPSPEFVARVRERVRQEPAVGAAIGWWPRLAFGAVVATAAIVVATLWIDHPRPGPAVVATRTAARAPLTESMPVPAVEPSPTISPRPTPRTPTRVAVRMQKSEILVPDDQRLALNRLLIAVREGRAVVPAEGRALEDENGHLLELRPIEVPPINSIDLLPGAPTGKPGERDK